MLLDVVSVDMALTTVTVPLLSNPSPIMTLPLDLLSPLLAVTLTWLVVLPLHLKWVNSSAVPALLVPMRRMVLPKAHTITMGPLSGIKPLLNPHIQIPIIPSSRGR